MITQYQVLEVLFYSIKNIVIIIIIIKIYYNKKYNQSLGR